MYYSTDIATVNNKPFHISYIGILHVNVYHSTDVYLNKQPLVKAVKPGYVFVKQMPKITNTCVYIEQKIHPINVIISDITKIVIGSNNGIVQGSCLLLEIYKYGCQNLSIDAKIVITRLHSGVIRIPTTARLVKVILGNDDTGCLKWPSALSGPPLLASEVISSHWDQDQNDRWGYCLDKTDKFLILELQGIFRESLLVDLPAYVTHLSLLIKQPTKLNLPTTVTNACVVISPAGNKLNDTYDLTSDYLTTIEIDFIMNKEFRKLGNGSSITVISNAKNITITGINAKIVLKCPASSNIKYIDSQNITVQTWSDKHPLGHYNIYTHYDGFPLFDNHPITIHNSRFTGRKL